ncbi:mandelate racemase/muconate lactonizing enzyme family protein [Devosia sp. A16]|uniref:mandelate racemase/muconate lactonizing enzyme family protein n=1 Tax=Devosia sp. A16 TaxID=1736675 RepID=UPI0006D7F772|nr:mandelate racemase/muconate lactonizing enzyme family protein [Devosia sp. A16]
MTDKQLGRIENAITTHSNPSELRITDMRLAVVAANYDYPILRIDTNQGVYGLGEVRDAGHASNALQFKSMLIGQNPCNVDMIFRAIKRFGNWGREGGGVSGIEIALMDLIGKVYGVPCYQLLGGKYRDKVRLYGDTPTPDDPTPEDFVEAVKGRRDRGLTWIKFDLRPSLFETGDSPLIGHDARHETDFEMGKWFKAPMAGRGVKLTEETIERAAHVVSEVRKAVGNGIQLCVDHFGENYLTADEVIRLGKALEPYNLAWMEDPVSRFDIPGHKVVADALLTPIAAGEDLYLRDGFREAIQTRAFDIVHPDLLTSGGLMETKRISDDAEEQGIPTALHCAGSPIGFMANIHTAAAISSFLACEHHGLDLPFWESLVTGLPKDYMADGYVTVPDAPGLGVDLNLEAIEENLRTPGTMFLPTDEWNTPKLGFWRPDDRWPE